MPTNKSLMILTGWQGKILPKTMAHHDANPIAIHVFRRDSNIL
jgi:hypothetical protein